ncbi:MAG: hypothetical protein A2107_08930 [Verrucomicrobia bacterium GWF2_62_7]|nr:MAG: hypothetical protein A2107_08930 [Verrucomicrobia bacterium GWF2_62_7]
MTPAGPSGIRSLFFTVTDHAFFPGTLATVNSILHFHDTEGLEIVVVEHEAHALSDAQRAILASHARVRLLGSSTFEQAGRKIGPWELKAYAAADLAAQCQVLIGIDSDCMLCAPVEDEIKRCLQTGGFHGGKDGDGSTYDESYAPYGIAAQSHNTCYMSTSLFFLATTPPNRQVLDEWALRTNQAIYNNTGPCPGHGDQGVLNAVLFARQRTADVHLLDNDLWSQHWRYWDTITEWWDGQFINLTAGGRPQRSFHCGGAEKFWEHSHRDRVLGDHASQSWPYVWFLTMLWFGRCQDWKISPSGWLPDSSHHLAEDLARFLPMIFTVHPDARRQWDGITDAMIDFILRDIPRALSLGGGSLTELFQLVDGDKTIRRYVEIGGYEGGSILAVALRFANRDIDFHCVESFMGNLNGTMDGHRLPRRTTFERNLARFPSLRVHLEAQASPHGAAAFDDTSIDFLFIDGCHETPALLADIDTWLPKIRPAGWIAGDDYGWASVREAVHQRFPNAEATRSGCVWMHRRKETISINSTLGSLRKLIFKNHLSPGDIVTLTAAVRDLHLSYPGKFITDVRTTCPALWEHNPFITPVADEDPQAEVIECHYPLIHESNTAPYHMLHGFRLFLEERLGVAIKAHAFKGDIHLSADEKTWMSQIEEMEGVGTRFWIIVSGGKIDFTAKWWDPDRAQAVVDHFKGRIRFVQCGEAQHHHPPLRDVIDLRGNTSARQLVRLMYHADGVVCPVTFLMHLAAAVEIKPGRPKNRACVVIAGGREPSQWEAYPHHQFLHTNGMLPCCDQGGCWKSRVEPLGDGDEKDKSLCLRPIALPSGRKLPQCLDMITARQVIDAVENYLPHSRPDTPTQQDARVYNDSRLRSCPHCLSPVSTDDFFCTNCGDPLVPHLRLNATDDKP